MNDSKILIFVINNTGQWPTYFCLDLIKLLEETRKEYPNTEVRTINTCSINEMRNFACRNALGLRKQPGLDDAERVDYLVQLDVDHKYSPTFIIDLMKHNKDVVTGCTSNRRLPFNQTQFKKLQLKIKAVDNIANPSPDDELIKIEASGPVGMLIKTDVLDKLTYPYYRIEHIGNEDGRKAEDIMGGDIYFTKKLKEAEIDVWLDPKITFPHEVANVFVDRGQLQF